MSNYLRSNFMLATGRSANRTIRNAARTDHPVNEGANTLDIARNVIDMMLPRKRLDSGTWGVMGIGTGFAIGVSCPLAM